MGLPNAYRNNMTRKGASYGSMIISTGHFNPEDGEIIWQTVIRYAAGRNNPILSIPHGIAGLIEIVDVQACVDNFTRVQSRIQPATIDSSYSVADANLVIHSGSDMDYSDHDGIIVVRFTRR